MSAPTVVILAGGSGTRMKSALPKLAHELCGQPLLLWSVNAACAAFTGVEPVVVVPSGGVYDDLLAGRARGVVQVEPRGTGDAVGCALPFVPGGSTVVVLSGDVPLVEPELLRSLVDAHASNAATVVTVVLDDPSGYGRVVRGGDGEFLRVVETKVAGDATAVELEIREVNAGIYAFDGEALRAALAEVGSDNAQGEVYLPDVLAVMLARGLPVGTLVTKDADVVLGVNDRTDLAAVRSAAQRRIHRRHMLAGVTIVDPPTTSIDVDVAIGADAVIEPCTQLLGSSAVGAGARVGPHATLIDARAGERASVVHSHLQECEVDAGAAVGPFAYLRPGTVLRAGANLGAGCRGRDG